MSDPDYFAKYRSYFLSQKDEPHLSHSPAHLPFITISREAGAGADTIAHLLAEKLNAENDSDAPPWTVFDKNLINQVLEDQQLPKEIARRIPEDSDLSIQTLLGELFGLHPSMWTIFHHIGETILKLAKLGRCIIVGRGGNIITSQLKGGIHIRLVADHAFRLKHLQTHFQLDEKTATKYLHEYDDGRRRYVKANFDKNINDPLLYSAILNVGNLGFQRSTEAILSMLAKKPSA